MTLPAWRPGSDSITSCPLSLPEAGSKQGRPCVLRSPPSCLSSYPILGRLGKQKKKKVLVCMWRVTLVVAWALSPAVFVEGCAGDLGEGLQSGHVLPLRGLQGRWVGPVTPSDPGCGNPTKGLLSIGPKGFGLDPFRSTLIIQGEVDESGRLSGSTRRQGADHKELGITFDGSAVAPDAIEGTLQSGRCRWTVLLHRG